MTVVYGTKHALTRGITKFEGTICPDGRVLGPSALYYLFQGEYELTQEAAERAVEAMRAKRLRALDLQRKKLSSIKIEVVDLTNLPQRG